MTFLCPAIVSVQFCDKRSVDTRGLGVNEELFGSPGPRPVSLFAVPG